jgi:hypothetical protein
LIILDDLMDENPKQKWINGFLHYSVRIAAAAVTVAYLPVSDGSGGVYPSVSSGGVYPWSAVLRLLSTNTTMRTRT